MIAEFFGKFFTFMHLHLFERQSAKERDGFRLLLKSSKSLHGWGSVRAKPGAGNSICSPACVAETQVLEPSWVAFRSIT